MSSSRFYADEDEQYAKDLQLAIDIQARELQKAKERKKRGQNHESGLGDGFSRGALNADHMLFVACSMDGNEVAMLIDTGASTSAMSMRMVNLLGLESKMNSSFHGSARGVGSSSILGVVEHVNCMIGENVGFRSFFMVLEGTMPYCILGLDQMRRFNCIVDVGGNALIFGGRDGVSVPFLPKDQASSVAYSMMHDENENKSRSTMVRGAPVAPPTQPQDPKGWGSYLPWGKKSG